MKKCLILIPAYNPNSGLIEYIDDLLSKGIRDILVVNDGSRKSCSEIFETVADRRGCTVLTHAVNLGKGRAMKNGFNYFLNLPDLEEYSGVITVDSDGQHSAADVLRLQSAMIENPESLVLGCRDFDSDNVPFKSRYGNKITRTAFRLLYGMRISDTQTGLRGYPTGLIYCFIELYGERFEYETNILIEAADKKIPITEIPIETIYVNNNSETHFRPLKDSVAIYRLILGSFFKYTFSSILSFIIDIGLFQIALRIINRIAGPGADFAITLATAVSRICSSLFNFAVNRRIVFKSGGKTSAVMLKYYILCICQAALSAGIVTAVWKLFNTEAVFTKIIVDILLFILSFKIQKIWVFSNRKGSKKS